MEDEGGIEIRKTSSPRPLSPHIILSGSSIFLVLIYGIYQAIQSLARCGEDIIVELLLGV